MGTRKEAVSAELVNENFGTRLASIRRVKGISQSALGQRVDLSRGTISNLEAGIQNVQLHQVFALADALDVPVSELLPLLSDVLVFDDSPRRSDRVFLEIAKRQLVDLETFGDDD